VPLTEAELAAQLRVPGLRLVPILASLRERGLVEGGGPEPLRLTPLGRSAHDQLVAARREGLHEYLDGLDPERHPELQGLLDALARDVVSAIPEPHADG
jgi:hypothetical protein